MLFPAFATNRCRARAALMLALLLFGPFRPCDAQVPPVSGPVCGYCDGPIGRCGCYATPGDPPTNDPTPTGNPVDAPIIAMPVGTCVGLIGGGFWYGRHMAGKYPRKSLLSSYHDFHALTKGSDTAFDAGGHLGGLPWLVLALPTWPVRCGIAALVKREPRPAAPEQRPSPAAAPSRAEAEAAKALQAERDACAGNYAEWAKGYRRQFQKHPSPAAQLRSESIRYSLKTKAPPLPWKTLPDLAPGDVLLVEPDSAGGAAIRDTERFIDRLSSHGGQSPACHTLVFLKEVRGKRFFLDNQPGEGARIIPEDVFLERYGHRLMHRAQTTVPTASGVYVAEPLRPREARKLWDAALAAHQKENQERVTVANPVGADITVGTNYGTGGDDMVCSELSRWALVKAGRTVGTTTSAAKRAVGIDFGPADFFDPEQHFLVTPLGQGFK